MPPNRGLFPSEFHILWIFSVIHHFSDHQTTFNPDWKHPVSRKKLSCFHWWFHFDFLKQFWKCILNRFDCNVLCHLSQVDFIFCHVLCGWRNKKLYIFEPSSVIMVLNDLINFEFSNLGWHNITLKNWIWWMKVDFIIVHICLHCKRSFTIWSGVLPQCTLDVLIFHHLSLHNGSSFHNLSECVYWACIVVESAVHILLLENSQMNWNIFSESWCCWFLCCICSTLSPWWIRPLHCSWSCLLFNDIFSEVFW